MMKATHFGTATLLLEVLGLRILTDPVFDNPGSSSDIANLPLTRYSNLLGASVRPKDVLPLDIILLSHDHHHDNLDHEGRKLLPLAKHVFTTTSAAKRLKGNSVGLKTWQTISLPTPAGIDLKITATPCRHGPIFSLPIVGRVNGFLLEWETQKNGGIYISGDTVFYSGIEKISQKFKVDIAFLHVGAARFKATAKIRYTMNAAEAVKTAQTLAPKKVVPIHYEGWSHFSEGRNVIESEFQKPGLENLLHWMPLGKSIEFNLE